MTPSREENQYKATAPDMFTVVIPTRDRNENKALTDAVCKKDVNIQINPFTNNHKLIKDESKNC